MSHLFARSKHSGLPSFAPAISFLQGAGQGHIVSQVKIALININCCVSSFTVKTSRYICYQYNREQVEST